MSLQLQGATGASMVVPQGATRGAALTGLSGAATTYSTSAVHLMLDGEWQALVAAKPGAATPTVDAIDGSPLFVAPGKARAFVWMFDAAGTTKIAEGKQADYIGAVEQTGLEIPAVPAGHVPFAVVTIACNPAKVGNFLVGVNNWNTTDVVIGTIRHLAQPLLGPVKTA